MNPSESHRPALTPNDAFQLRWVPPLLQQLIIYIYCYSVHYKTMRPFSPLPSFVSSFVPPAAAVQTQWYSLQESCCQAVHSANMCTKHKRKKERMKWGVFSGTCLRVTFGTEREREREREEREREREGGERERERERERNSCQKGGNLQDAGWWQTKRRKWVKKIADG